MAKFHVKETLVIESRLDFVLVGVIVEGEISPGMLVCVQFNSNTTMTGRIACMEFARRSGEDEDICLCLRCTDAQELEIWLGLQVSDEVLEVTADGPNETGNAA